MKFRFLSGLDSPDWLLAGISMLSKVTVVKARLLAKEVLATLLRNDGLHPDMQNLSKLMQDGKNIQPEDEQLVFATMEMILSSAARNNVTDATLDGELQQLGLPAEHASGICKIYAQNREEMIEMQAKQFFRFGRVIDFKWRIDRYLAINSNSDPSPDACPGVLLQLCVSNDTQNKGNLADADAVVAAKKSNSSTQCMFVDRPTLKFLTEELRIALKCMGDSSLSSAE